MLQTTITNEQKVNCKINPKTAAGHDAPLDGVPTWEVTSGDATVEVAEDGKSAFLISGDSASESKIMITADAKIGEGVTTIQQEISLIVTLAEASDLGTTFDTPVAK